MRATINNGTVTITPLTAREYSVFRQNSRALEEDYEWLFRIRRSIARDAPGFQAPQLYATLRQRFGESTTMYDDWKCSLGYPFELRVTKGEHNSTYLMLFTDYKGGLSVTYNRHFTPDELATTSVDPMCYCKPIQDEFSRDDMRVVSSFFAGFLLGYWETSAHAVTDSFARTIPCVHFVYGVRDATRFERTYEDHEAYTAAVRELARAGIPLNLTRPNVALPPEEGPGSAQT